MRFGDWVVARLRARGMKIAVNARRAANGLALVLEDRTDYGAKENR